MSLRIVKKNQITFFSKKQMTEISHLAELQADTKANVRVVVLDIMRSKYSKGERTKFTVKDENGTQMDVVGFQDVYDLCSHVKVGTTYVMNDVLSSTYNDSRQLKLNSFSTIHISAKDVDFADSTISDIAHKNAGDFINIVAVITDVTDSSKTSATGSKSQKYTVSDLTGSIPLYAINDAASEVMQVGNIVCIRAKIGLNLSSISTFNVMSTTQNERLFNWWTENQSEITQPLKRMKPNPTRIADINAKMVGEKIEICAIITSLSVGATQTQSGRHKRVLEVTDASCVSIEVTIFGDEALKEYQLHSAFCVIATVSSWNTLSLNTNGSLLPDDKPVNRFKNITEWWNNEGRIAEINSIVAKSVKNYTVSEMLQKNSTQNDDKTNCETKNTI